MGIQIEASLNWAPNHHPYFIYHYLDDINDGMIIWDHWWISYSIPKSHQNHPKPSKIPSNHLWKSSNYPCDFSDFPWNTFTSNGRVPGQAAIRPRCVQVPGFPQMARRFPDLMVPGFPQLWNPLRLMHVNASVIWNMLEHVGTCWNMLEHRGKTKKHMCNRQTISGIQKLDVVRGVNAVYIIPHGPKLRDCARPRCEQEKYTQKIAFKIQVLVNMLALRLILGILWIYIYIYDIYGLFSTWIDPSEVRSWNPMVFF